MNSNNKKLWPILLTIAALTIAAYWYWSPYLAIRSMQAAAQAKDPDTFNQYVDYAKLRESLKGQFNARMASALGQNGDNDMQRAGAALGTMLGLAMVDKMIDAMVRPEMVMRAMNSARLESPTMRSSEVSGADMPKLKWAIERKTTHRIIAYGNSEGNATQLRMGFVFDREGFAKWRLTEIRLPEEKPQ